MKFATQPPFFKCELRKDQLHAIYLLESFESKKKIVKENKIIKSNLCFYSDKVGAGKTLTILGLIARDVNEVEKYESVCYFGYGPICEIITSTFENYINSTFIVVSPSLVSQWESEIAKTKLTHYTIDKVKKIQNYDPDDEYDIILCSATMYKKFYTIATEYYWKRFIIDEADSIHIAGMQTLRSNTTILMTATPSFVTQPRKQSWIPDLFRHVNYQDLVIKNDDEYIDRYRTIPEPITITHTCHQNVASKVLTGIIDKNVIEMIDAGNISESIKLLGGESSNTNIIDIVTNNLKKRKIECEHEISRQKNVEYWKTQLDTVNRKLSCVTERFENILAEECPICMSDKQDPVMVPCCQGIACGKCLLSWTTKNGSCPLCRNTINHSQLIHINKDCEKDDKDFEKIKTKNKELTKPETIINILDKNPDGKFLIFSSYDDSFVTLRNLLNDKGVTFDIVMGTKASRDKYIREFKNGITKVLFINSRKNGSGIDLPCTTDVILYHTMPEEVEIQCIGRGQRFGRKIPLRIHKFEEI